MIRVPACAGMTLCGELSGETYPHPPKLRVCFKRSGRTGGVSSVIRGDRERGARPGGGLTPRALAWPSERKAAQSSTAPSTPVSRRGPQGVRPNLHVWDVTDAPQTYNSSGIRRRPTHLLSRGGPLSLQRQAAWRFWCNAKKGRAPRAEYYRASSTGSRAASSVAS